MSDDDTYLICAVVDGHEPVRGSIIASCIRCSCDVWVAPTGQQILGADHALTICVPCGMAAMINDPEAKRMHMTAAQLDELREERRRRGE